MKTETRRTSRAGAQTTTQPEHVRLTVRQAATMSGRGVTTIRRLLEKGLISAERDDSGQYWILEETMRHYLATDAPPPKDSASSRERHRKSSRMSDTPPGDSTHALIARLETHNRDLQETLEHERRVSADLRSENRELTTELLKISREMQALLTGNGKTEGLLSALRFKNPFK